MNGYYLLEFNGPSDVEDVICEIVGLYSTQDKAFEVITKYRNYYKNVEMVSRNKNVEIYNALYTISGVKYTDTFKIINLELH